MKNPSIAIIGSGSIGLYYGGKLAAAGADVRFLIRSGFEEAREKGIRIHSEDQVEAHVQAPKVFRMAGDIEHFLIN